ncbi:branched-chain amino acid ABC transporter permease [Candidatus Entotheonella palauensis]|uniref:branched-chain amino acid ABC transporter permease n=1 Tax=Candidatus Entotheonella palauensis TaxID=93172 RepID=UPI000B7DFD4D|nr:branched-chain amino acid ABC transporter permease [Candidatus Entotheonella palauensis]
MAQGLAMPTEPLRPLLNAHRFRPYEALPWLLAIAVFFAFPGYRLLATQILCMILFALSLDLLVGYTGIATLGHTAFFGTGAYAAALLAANGWAEPLSGLMLAALSAALLGGLSSWVVLRTHGLTLLMLTMALTIMLHELANDFDDITGGFDGINFENTPIFAVFEFDPIWFGVNYWYVLAVLFVLFLIIRAIVYSPFGRMLIGIRENSRRMHAIGTPVHSRMVAIYVMSSAIAGVAGALWVQVQGNITTAVLSFELSGEVLIMLILGGTGRLYGAFVGAAAFKLLENLTEQILGTDQPYWMLAIGLLLVLTVLFARRGLLGLLEDTAALFQRERL